ncbi:MAG: biotin synthase BioB [Lentisphaeraceae bacterium]|nr:biotin synthase BioB [Lentisphaeraceae bacterium]
MSIDYQKWTELALENKPFPKEDALAILSNPDVDILKLTSAAGEVRLKHFGKKVKVHQINNIQNGYCPEDCGYCGQSKDSEADINQYKMKSEDDIVAEAYEAKQKGVYRYCMVSSGRGPNDKKADELTRIIKRINEEVGIKTCLSAGLVSDDQAKMFKAAGLDRLNHNLNTSEKHTPNIVSTHTYQDRIDTLNAAKKAGLDNCAGMIVGMGETDEDILDVAYELKKREVPSIPINFLVPIEGNKLFDFDQLNPERCLKILAVFRFVNPDAELRMGGGREGHLRGLQSLALYIANSLFIEGYLVTRGDKKHKAFRMIEDAGFEIDGINLEAASESSSSRFAIDENPDIMNPKTAQAALGKTSCSAQGSCS